MGKPKKDGTQRATPRRRTLADHVAFLNAAAERCEKRGAAFRARKKALLDAEEQRLDAEREVLVRARAGEVANPPQ